jgi:glucose-1-phosphate thymidylyltransferase
MAKMTDELIGLVPAAGKGLRLGLPYPKELYPIIRDNRYKPVSQYVLENLTAAGVRHIVFVINETKHQLIGYFGDGNRFGCHISYVVQEQQIENNRSTSPGLARALNSAYHLLRDKTVCFGMPDTIMTPPDVFALALKSSNQDDDVILGLYRTERPEKFGMVRMDEDDRVLQIVDKPSQTDLEYMWGFITWRMRFTEHLHACIRQKGLTDFAMVMNAAIEAGMRFRGIRIEEGTYADIGTYEEIMELEQQHRAP